LALALTVSLVAGGVPVAAAPDAAEATAVDAFVPGAAKKDGAGLRPPEAAPERPSGEARELPERRTDRSRTFAHSDGSFRTEVFDAPVHFKDKGGSWQSIDNTLVASTRPGVGYENKANNVGVSLPADLGTGLVSVSSGSHGVGFALEGAKGAPVVKAHSATYDDALPGVAATYRVGAAGVKEELALAGPHSPSQFRFAVSTSGGLTARENPGGGIDFVDGGGRLAMAFPAPYMYEAANEANSSTAVRLRIAQASPLVMELAADRGWLAAPGRSWPVVVDPWLTVPEAENDTYLRNGTDANTNYSTDHALKIGFDGTRTSRGLLRFATTSAIPEPHRVREAFVKLYMYSQDFGTSAVAVAAHGLTEPYVATQATWNSRSSGVAWASPGASLGPVESTNTSVGGGSLGWKDWNVTNLAQSWADSGGATNNGIALKATDEAAVARALFRSRDYGRDVDASDQPYMAIHWDPILGVDDHYSYETRALSDRRSVSVNVASGNLVVSESDLSIGGTGLDLSVERQYNSRRNQEGGDIDLGQRWSMSPQTDYRGVIQRNGDFVLWGGREQFARFAKRADGTFVDAPGYDASLVRRSDGRYEMTMHKTNTKMDFEWWGALNYIRDRNGNTLSMAWRQHANGNWYVYGIEDTQDRDTAFARHATTAKVTSVTDPTGRVSTYGYNGDNLSSFTDARGKTTTYTYDANGYLTRITDPKANPTKFAYDAAGRVTSMTQVDNTSTDTGPPTTFPYNHTTRTSTVTDANNKATTYTFDPQGRVTKVTDPLGHVRDRKYSSNSNVEQFNGNAGVSAAFSLSYDTNNNLKSIQSPASASGQSGATTAFSYPAFSAGNPLSYLPDSRTDAQNNCRAFGYDARGNMTASYDGLTPSGGSCATGTNTKKNTLTYNPNGTLQSATNPEANKNDALRMTCPGTSVRAGTCYGYDAAGNLTSVSYPSGSGLGNQTIAVDSLSRVTSVTDAKGQKTCRTYDALDHLTRLDYAAGATCPAPADPCPAATCVTYAYDEVGNLTSRVDNTGTTAFAYDRLNRPTKKSLPGGTGACAGQGGMTYAYDPVGNQTSVCDDGGTVTYRYNADNTAKDLAEPGGSCSTSPATKCTTFGYNDPVTGTFEDGRRTTTTYPTSPAVVMTSTYDPAGNTKKIEAKANGAATPLTSYSYTYTQGTADRDLRQSMTDNVTGINTAYGYDASGRLSGADASAGDDYTYAYDDNSNRTTQTKAGVTTTYTYNLASNQLTGVSGQAAAPSFDANGNQTRTHTGVVPAYNAKDQTQSFTPPGASAVNASYADADSTEMVSAGPVSLASGLRGVARDGPRPGGSTYHYTRDPSGTLVGRRSSSGSQYYYLFDALGSVVGLATTSGTLADNYRYTYDPFGNQTSPEPASNNPWRYAGGLYMDDLATGTKLTKFGTRFYDPSVGRWTQQDAVAGSISDPSTMNRYSYVGCDPVNFTDPAGFAREKFLGVIGNCGVSRLGFGASLLGAATSAVGFVTSTGTGNAPGAAISAVGWGYSIVQADQYARNAEKECK